MTDEIDDLLNEDPTLEDDADSSTTTTNEETSETDTSNTTSVVPETSVPSADGDLAEGEIGHVLASEEIMVGRDEYNVNAFITTTERNEIRVGDYVQIPYPNSNDELFAVTDKLRYEPYTDLDDKSDTHNHISRHQDLDESEFVLVAALDPIAILSPTQNGSLDRGIVNRIPKPNTPVSLSRDDEYLRTGLSIPDEGPFCGYLSVGGEEMVINGDKFPYYLSNPGIDPETGEPEPGEPAIFRHLLVAGSTGKGKTHFTKNLLRQFVDGKRYPIEHHETGEQLQGRLNIVILDPENEYWQMGEEPELDDETKQKLRRQGIKVGGVDDLEVFVPSIGNVPNPGTGTQQPFGIPFELVRSRPQLLMPYQPRETIRSALEMALDSYFDHADAEGETPTYTDFRSYVQTNEELQDDSEIASQTWSAMIRRIKEPTFENVFDHGMSSLTDLANDMFREGQVTVIPTSHLRGAKEHLTVLSILSYIIENKIDDHHVVDQIKNTPMLVAVDEAHNYFSSPDSLREQYIVRRAREAVKQGRKDKLGLMMITQNPEDIDDDILKQINTNIFLGLREEVVEKVPSIPRGFKRDIPKFGKGQAVVKAPDVESVEVIGLPDCVTKHE
ncbi:ATP-binding protein [Haloarchaeobius amylolyticus]|uniref:ATP-binding protein n=1 Tax=Haloarchaeobius amylolyticus TaxID=1198296 RepID=UPI00226F9543|nr:ATP-binding protein [Haloarchaeobius amylolyticus]